MSWVAGAVAAFLTGILASLGLGGGMVLIIYLTLFASMAQLQAQGINLIFFLPIAALALILHTKNKLVEWKKILPAILTGSVAVSFSSLCANRIGSDWLQKAFAVFLILAGAYALVQSFRKKSSAQENQEPK